MRWIVGDLQGCVRELEDLLAAIGFDEHRDELWAAGDVINRGPHSLETARLWRALGGRGVIGNHEVYALCARSGRWPRKSDTLDALYDAPDGEALLGALRDLPALAFLPGDGDGVPDTWLVHAGLHPEWTDLHALASTLGGPEQTGPHDDDWLLSEAVSFATRVRCCTETGERTRFDRQPEDCPPPYQPWDALYAGATRVVHGHWAWRGHYRGPKTIGLDSGCVYGGPLTAWCVEEDRVVQVPARG